MTKRIPVPHPGETLLEDFMEPLKISQSRLAREIGVDSRRINEIVNGKRGITADTALRLGKFFGVEAQFWLNLQNFYDLRIKQEDAAFVKALDKIDQVANAVNAY
jgi:addiction module HigA family antidote